MKKQAPRRQQPETWIYARPMLRGVSGTAYSKDRYRAAELADGDIWIIGETPVYEIRDGFRVVTGAKLRPIEPLSVR